MNIITTDSGVTYTVCSEHIDSTVYANLHPNHIAMLRQILSNQVIMMKNQGMVHEDKHTIAEAIRDSCNLLLEAK